MSRSKFKYNKKRKHYSYQFKDVGNLRKNLLLHSNPENKKGWSAEKQKIFLKTHTRLFRHPNPKKPKDEVFYVENRIYTDSESSFASRDYEWKWDTNDKRKIKRLKKGRRTR